MATMASPNGKSAQAVVLSVCAVLPFVVALAPNLLQEVGTIYLRFVVGLGLVVAALARAGAAMDAKRADHEATRWGVGRSCGHALHVTYAGCAHFPAHGGTGRV
jgi:hypothetical protein